MKFALKLLEVTEDTFSIMIGASILGQRLWSSCSKCGH